MIGAGTIISPIIKIVTTVAILAAVYFFFVKPALETTENITNSISNTVENSVPDIDNLVPDVQKDIDKAFKQAQNQSGSSSTDVDKLFDCVNAAGTNTAKINACTEKFTP